MPIDANLNQLWARAFVEELHRAGVRHAVVCPGSRSAPLALALAEHGGLRTWSIIDERSAAFFALGLGKESGVPAVAIATSGTAGVNFHPAIVEASMAHVPLVAVTADRPPELQGWGALQTIPQHHLYGEFARWFVDLGLPDPTGLALRHVRATAARCVVESVRSPRGPVHVNAPFRDPLAPNPDDEPLSDEIARAARSEDRRTRIVPAVSSPDSKALDAIRGVLQRAPRGVIACGNRDADDGFREAVLGLGRFLGYPVLGEATSQVRFGPGGEEAIALYDSILRSVRFSTAHRPEVVLHFGSALISKVMQSWIERANAQTFVFSDDGALVDPDHAGSTMVIGSPVEACVQLSRGSLGLRPDSDWSRSFHRAERRARSALESVAGPGAPLIEPLVAREIVAALPQGANLFASSSMPIRDLDAFAPGTSTRIRVLANRGANGIDGVTSTALGVAAASGRPTVLMTGDLAFIHDLGGLLTARRHALSITVVVLNNDGGGIFSFLPISQFPEHFEKLFGTPHGLDLSRAAALFDATYGAPRTAFELRAALKVCLEGGVHVLEIRSDRQQNVAHHREVTDRIARALEEGPSP